MSLTAEINDLDPEVVVEAGRHMLLGSPYTTNQYIRAYPILSSIRGALFGNAGLLPPETKLEAIVAASSYVLGSLGVTAFNERSVASILGMVSPNDASTRLHNEMMAVFPEEVVSATARAKNDPLWRTDAADLWDYMDTFPVLRELAIEGTKLVYNTYGMHDASQFAGAVIGTTQLIVEVGDLHEGH